MNKIHMKKYFMDWYEGKLKQQKKEQIKQHLRKCPDCHDYFDKMQMFLAEPGPSALPELNPDYFLPTKIKELAKQSEGKQSSFESWKKKIHFVLGAATIIAALLAGVFLGKRIATKQDFSEAEIVLSYSSMFTDEGIGEVWDNIITERNGEKQ